jgi:uncharacterized membrane protein
MAPAPQAKLASTPLHGLLRRVTRWFLAGVLTFLPLAITVGVIAWVGDFIRRIVGPDTFVRDILRR